MSNVFTRFLILLTCASVVFVASPLTAVAQEKKDEAKKPAGSTADTWRQALPPEAERTGETVEAASVAPASPSREEVERNVLALERKWMEALKARDASTLGQVVADDFSFVGPRTSGKPGDRDKYFAHALRELKLESYEFGEQTVRLYGRTAVVSVRLTQKATGAGGEDLSGSYYLTDVWVSRDGIWRVVSRHASLMPAAK